MGRLFFIALLVVALASCRSARKIGAAINKKDTTGTAARIDSSPRSDSALFISRVWQQLEANRINYKTFSAKLDLDYRDNSGKKYDVNAVIRMQKDSAIWVSINALLGIEAMRALITKDSVKLLDKLNKEYIARRVDYLQEVTSLPLDLATLQALIIGNPVFLDSNNIVSYAQTGESVSLLGIGQWFKNLLTLSDADKTLRHSKLDDVNPTRNRTADLTYSDYENKKDVKFATRRKIEVAETKKLDIAIKFKQYDFNEEVSFPFNIPKNYTRR